jgi:hypothetical protein
MNSTHQIDVPLRMSSSNIVCLAAFIGVTPCSLVSLQHLTTDYSCVRVSTSNSMSKKYFGVLKLVASQLAVTIYICETIDVPPAGSPEFDI